MVASTRPMNSSRSLREQGVGSGRSKTAEKDTLAMSSSGDAMAQSCEVRR